MKRLEFGYLKTGEKVTKYILEVGNIKVGVLNYGGIITNIMIPDRDENIEDIVLGYNNIKDYEEKSPYFGALVGRIAGRIAEGRFNFLEKEYKLVQNNGKNNIHGGKKGLDKRIFDVKKLDIDGGEGVELRYKSPHLEEGFLGKVLFKIRYILKGDTLELDYEGEVDRKTIVNLTNHSYFNLSGNCKEDILNHKMYIDSDEILELDDQSAPTGKKIKVESTPFDFREIKLIGQDIEGSHYQVLQGRGYDHPFLLNNKNKEGIKNIDVEIFHEESGRKVEVITDQKVAVIYTGNYLTEDEGVLSCGKISKKRLGVCIETQDIPNHMNLDNFETIVYSPEKKYKSNTKFIFSVIKK